MKDQTQRIWKIFFRSLDLTRRIVLGIVFWSILTLLIVIIAESGPQRIKRNSLLVVMPHGFLVDAYSSAVEFLDIALDGLSRETLLDDLVTAIDSARDDERIAGLWLKLDDLYPSGAAATGELAEAIARFSRSGKPVIASSDYYDTSRYRIASEANKIIVDRLGAVFPTGYGYWRAYFADGLKKFGIETQVFRSSDSKSGPDSFIRNSISEDSRLNEERLLGDLWDEWLSQVATNRRINQEVLKEWIDNYDIYLLEADGNASQSAKTANLVDFVDDGGNFQDNIDDIFGSDLNHIDAEDYILARKERNLGKSVIAVVPIVGSLIYGKGNAGMSSSSDIVSAIEKARSSPGVKAIVLRINSPGGDVRAGEDIRRALEKTRENWKLPIVVSFGNIAASGGYWIAVESDLIVTRPESITGSIGVYSLSMNFRKGLEEWLGVRIDGFGTTPWSGAGDPGRDFDERLAKLYQAGVIDIDRMFRNLVVEKRNLSAEVVDQTAGGIPWSGKRAVTLELADREGGLADARTAAAELAGLTEWRTEYFEADLSLRRNLLGWLLWGGKLRIGRKTLF